jgi:hypothetical protein
MKKMKLWVLATAMVVASGATAQQASLPPINLPAGAGDITPQLRFKTDLVIESVAWAYTVPPGIMSGMLHTETPGAIVVLSPKIRVTVRNRGTERWASSGRVVAVVHFGTPEEIDARAMGSAHRGAGVSVVADPGPFVPSPSMSLPPFTGAIAIPGSLAPGETRSVDITLSGVAANASARSRLQVAVDKFYTARVDIQAQGEVQQKNNGADLVFRLNARGLAAPGSTLTQRVTDPAARGTVEVRAPGS